MKKEYILIILVFIIYLIYILKIKYNKVILKNIKEDFTNNIPKIIYLCYKSKEEVPSKIFKNSSYPFELILMVLLSKDLKSHRVNLVLCLMASRQLL